MIIPLLEKYATHYPLDSFAITLLGIHLNCRLNKFSNP
nr:MAG TPA: hypothetical protein [Caudoviricetes sp.]